ncbi:MAG: GNAT family N-acetyltransferase [Actinomycetota bacterium]|nr:GNAT family N-acetyltransferase [Actinomycetota bacterium]
MSPDFLAMARRLETTRLLLTPLEAADAERYAALIAERGPGARNFGMTVDEVSALIAEQAIAAAASGIGFLAVRRRAVQGKGDFLGYCGLLIGRGSLDEPEVAYELLRSAHGRGYATEAAGAVIQAARATGRHRLWATVGDWNAASFRVLAKCGFRRDHTVPGVSGDLVYLVLDLAEPHRQPENKDHRTS